MLREDGRQRGAVPARKPLRHGAQAPLEVHPGHNEVGMSQRWLDQPLMGRSNRGEVLLHHRLKGAAALPDIANETPDEPDAGGCLHEHRRVKQGAQGRLR